MAIKHPAVPLKAGVVAGCEILVEFLTKLKTVNAVSLSVPKNKLTVTNILLDVELGIIVADSPVTFVKVVLEVLKREFKVVD